MSARRHVSIAGLIALTAAPASAADDSKEEIRARKLTHAYAKCVVRARHDRAGEAILSNADNLTIMRRYPDLVISDCLSASASGFDMKFGGDLYRYALADALVNADYGASGDTDFSNRLPLAHLPRPDRLKADEAIASTRIARKRKDIEEGYRRALAVVFLSRYGECIVRRSPEKSRLWLLTPPDIPEETSRINELRSTFSECLDEGTLRFNRTMIRGAVAINYYRLARATPQPAAGKLQ